MFDGYKNNTGMMKSRTSTLILFVLCLNSFAQDSSLHINRSRFGIIFTPEYSYRTIQQYDKSGGHDYKQMKDTSELPHFGYSVGYSMLIAVKKRWFIETGLQVSMKSLRTTEEVMHPVIPDPAIPETHHMVYNTCYIDIPLKANFIILQNRFKLFSSVGVTASNYVSHIDRSVSTWADGHKTRENYAYGTGNEHKLVAYINTGLGIQLEISRGISIRLEPQFKHAIVPVLKHDNNAYKLDTWFYSFGLNFGMYLQFNSGKKK